MNDVKGNRREIYAAQTRAAVLDAARTLFVAPGYDATSIDDIARAAQSSKGAVYHHFPDKRAIFIEVFDSYQQEILQAAIAAMPTESATSWERIEAGTIAFVRQYAANVDAQSLLRQSMNVLGWEGTLALDERAALPMLRAMITEAVGSGEVAPMPEESAAGLLLTMFTNAVLMIATAADSAQAAGEMEAILLRLLSGLRTAS